MESGELVT